MLKTLSTLALVSALTPLIWAQGTPTPVPPQQASEGLSAYMAKLQAQPPPIAHPDKKLSDAQKREVAALASGSCKVLFSLIQTDTLGNVQQGFTPDQLEWFEKKPQGKHPDICYAPPAPDVRLVLFVTVKEDTYHGTRIVTNTSTHNNPINGTITGEDGSTADISGNQTTTSQSSVAVPYSVQYGIYTMTMMEPSKTPTWAGAGTNIHTLHVFQQRGLYHVIYWIGFGKGKHPVRTLVQEAVNWIDAGGLSSPLQGRFDPSDSPQYIPAQTDPSSAPPPNSPMPATTPAKQPSYECRYWGVGCSS